MFDRNQLVDVKWANKTMQWYIDRGYKFTKYGDIFRVSAKDLPPTSKTKVSVTCDYCGEEYDACYGNLMNRKNTSKEACKRCKTKKQHEGSYHNRAKYKFDKLKEICRENNYKLITDESEYTDSNMVVNYICNKHGVQHGIIDNIIHGHKCIHCSYEERGLNSRHSIEYISSVIECFNGNKLLNPDDYVGSNEHNLIIKCGSCGNSYETSFSDYTNNMQIRCKSCSKSESTGEMLIRTILEDYNIDFVQEMKFDDCRDIKCLPFDFYLSEYNIIIEFDGIQHFQETKYMDYETTKRHDQIKNEYCKNNNIDLLRIPYWDKKNIKDILIEKLNL